MKLLVIDIQKGITDSRLFNFDEFIDNTSRIIQAARDNQIEVIYFQHDDGPGTVFSIGDEEFEIAEQVHAREGAKIFTKNIKSCFGNKDFTDYVKDENTLMIVGLQTNFCIDATVKSAFERGYKVIVPQGANSTFDNDYMSGEETYKYYNDMMWPKRFATCVSVDEAIKLMQSLIRSYRWGRIIMNTVRMILCGNVEDSRMNPSEKVGVVSVVFVSTEEEKIKNKLKKLQDKNPEKFYMEYVTPLDVDLTSLEHYPSIEISKNDLQ